MSVHVVINPRLLSAIPCPEPDANQTHRNGTRSTKKSASLMHPSFLANIRSNPKFPAHGPRKTYEGSLS